MQRRMYDGISIAKVACALAEAQSLFKDCINGLGHFEVVIAAFV